MLGWFLCLGVVASGGAPGATDWYAWLADYDDTVTLKHRINAPQGYIRTPVECGGFGDWLRNLPLKAGNPPVHLFTGAQKLNQAAHAAVVDIDVGDRDLQQCADAIIRLRAEYLYAQGALDAIRFSFTSGQQAEFRKWLDGYRPMPQGDRVRWVKAGARQPSHDGLMEYLTQVFIYAGSYSLSQELVCVPDIRDMRIGDVFIQGGFPGHAVIVVDMAAHKGTSKKLFLLAQSYMPAQDVHVLRNPAAPALSPWYSLDFGSELQTPEWKFAAQDLKRFPAP